MITRGRPRAGIVRRATQAVFGITLGRLLKWALVVAFIGAIVAVVGFACKQPRTPSTFELTTESARHIGWEGRRGDQRCEAAMSDAVKKCISANVTAQSAADGEQASCILA